MLKVIRPRYDGRVDLGSLDGYMSNDNYFVDCSSAPFNFPQLSSNDKGYGVMCDSYKRENGYELYTKQKNNGICLTSPFLGNNLIISDTRFIGKTSAEVKALLSGIYLYYETTTQDKIYQLYNAISKQGNTYQFYNMLSLSMKSLLGKQDVKFRGNIGSWGYPPYVNPSDSNSFNVEFSIGISKKISTIQNHKYFVLFNLVEIDKLFYNYIGLVEPYAMLQGNVSGNDLYAITTAVSSSSQAISCFRVLDNSGTITVNYEIITDLTVLGLDNLTAQQFYDRFKDYFPLLASGKNIII